MPLLQHAHSYTRTTMTTAQSARAVSFLSLFFLFLKRPSVKEQNVWPCRNPPENCFLSWKVIWIKWFVCLRGGAEDGCQGGSHSQSSLKRKAMMNNSCVVRRGGGGASWLTCRNVSRPRPFAAARTFSYCRCVAANIWKRIFGVEERDIFNIDDSILERDNKSPDFASAFHTPSHPFFLPLSFSLFPLFVYKRTLHFFFSFLMEFWTLTDEQKWGGGKIKEIYGL